MSDTLDSIDLTKPKVKDPVDTDSITLKPKVKVPVDTDSITLKPKVKDHIVATPDAI